MLGRRLTIDRALTAVIVLLAAAAILAAYRAVRPFRVAVPEGGGVRPPGAGARPADVLTEHDLDVVWRGRDPESAPDALTNTRPRPTDEGAEAPPFKLRGVIFATDGSSCAFIESGGRMGLYGEGAAVEGWTVAAIEIGKVRVRKGDQERTLQVQASYVSRPLPRRGSANPAGGPSEPGLDSAAARAGAATDAERGEAARESTAEAPRVVRRVRPAPSPVRGADGQVAVPQELVETIRSDPASVRFGVQYRPALGPDGAMRGYAIDRVEPGSLAARYGLAPGDRILAVNGIPIDSPARIVQLYRRFRNSDSLRVRLQRGGRVREYVYFVK